MVQTDHITTYKSPTTYISDQNINDKRRDEHVATDTVYSDTHAVYDRCKQAHTFFEAKTMFTDVYGVKTDSQFVNTLKDFIRD